MTKLDDLIDDFITETTFNSVNENNKTSNDITDVLLVDNTRKKLKSTSTNGHIIIFKTLKDDITVFSNGTRVNLHDVVKGRETKVLEVRIRILNEGTKLLDAKLHCRKMCRKTRDASLDTLIQKRGSRSAGHKVMHRLHKKTSKTRL